MSAGGSSPLVFSGIFLPSPCPPAFAVLGVRRWGMRCSSPCCRADGAEPPARSFLLKLLPGGSGEQPCSLHRGGGLLGLGLLGGCHPPADTPRAVLFSGLFSASASRVCLSEMVKIPALLWEPGRSLCCRGGPTRSGWAVPCAGGPSFRALGLRVLLKLMSVFSFARN